MARLDRLRRRRVAMKTPLTMWRMPLIHGVWGPKPWTRPPKPRVWLREPPPRWWEPGARAPKPRTRGPKAVLPLIKGPFAARK